MTIKNTERVYLTYLVIILNPFFFSQNKKKPLFYISDFPVTLTSIKISLEFLSKSCAYYEYVMALSKTILRPVFCRYSEIYSKTVVFCHICYHILS